MRKLGIFLGMEKHSGTSWKVGSEFGNVHVYILGYLNQIGLTSMLDI
jgi:hypothetical protein